MATDAWDLAAQIVEEATCKEDCEGDETDPKEEEEEEEVEHFFWYERAKGTYMRFKVTDDDYLPEYEKPCKELFIFKYQFEHPIFKEDVKADEILGQRYFGDVICKMKQNWDDSWRIEATGISYDARLMKDYVILLDQ